MKVEKDYEEFLSLLNKHNVKYCIIGTFAVAFYAKPRYTNDIDILFEDIWQNRVTGEYGSENVHFIGLDDLIKNKKMSDRPSDKIDIELLEKNRKEKNRSVPV